MMTRPHPDGSRDLRIEDPSNLWLIHPAGRALLPHAVALGISANAVSVAGLVLGGVAAACFAQWSDWRFAILGLMFSVGWLIADGLDGMIARATGTASPVGRMLDGLCDHGVFALIYVTLAFSIGTGQAWALSAAAGIAHAVQSSLYEASARVFIAARAALPSPYCRLSRAMHSSGCTTRSRRAWTASRCASNAAWRATRTPPPLANAMRALRRRR